MQDKTQLYETKLTWAKKKAQLFWRGAFMVDIRKELYMIAKDYKWGESKHPEVPTSFRASGPFL